MTTEHVLEQLPLWIEGDLPDQAAEAVQVHLAACPSCQAAAEQLRTSQLWLKEALEPPFDASDFADLRQKVLGQIRLEQAAPPVRRFAIRPALLAACAALLVIGLAWLQERPHVVAPPLQKPAASPLVAATAIPADPSPPQIQVAQAHSAAVRMRARPREEAKATASAGITRMEFQLPDSNIRIIWLAQATPLPDRNDAPQEAL